MDNIVEKLLKDRRVGVPKEELMEIVKGASSTRPQASVTAGMVPLRGMSKASEGLVDAAPVMSKRNDKPNSGKTLPKKKANVKVVSRLPDFRLHLVI